jgi:hypothetical protein
MTIKPIKVGLEKEPRTERVRFLKREQEEQEARRSLRDFLRHKKEEDEMEDNDDVAPNTF